MSQAVGLHLYKIGPISADWFAYVYKIITSVGLKFVKQSDNCRLVFSTCSGNTIFTFTKTLNFDIKMEDWNSCPYQRQETKNNRVKDL